MTRRRLAGLLGLLALPSSGIAQGTRGGFFADSAIRVTRSEWRDSVPLIVTGEFTATPRQLSPEGLQALLLRAFGTRSDLRLTVVRRGAGYGRDDERGAMELRVTEETLSAVVTETCRAPGAPARLETREVATASSRLAPAHLLEQVVSQTVARALGPLCGRTAVASIQEYRPSVSNLRPANDSSVGISTRTYQARVLAAGDTPSSPDLVDSVAVDPEKVTLRVGERRLLRDMVTLRAFRGGAVADWRHYAMIEDQTVVRQTGADFEALRVGSTRIRIGQVVSGQSPVLAPPSAVVTVTVVP